MDERQFQVFGDDPFTDQGGINGGVGYQGTPEEIIDSLNKSLSVGYGYALADKTGGGALRMESLEETLKLITFEEKSAAFWLAAPKKKAGSTVEEYTTVEEVDGAQFYAEGGVPDEAQDELKRAYEQIKYLGAIGKVSDVAPLERTQSNPRTVEQQNKTRAIIRLADKSGFFGDARYNSYEYDGIFRQVERKAKYPSQNIIDLRGRHLRLEDLNNAAAIIASNYGNPENLKAWMSIQAKQNYVDGLIRNKQLFVNQGNADAVIGLAGKKFEAGNGSGSLHTDVFLGQYPDRFPYPKINDAGNFVATHSKAPLAPTNTSIAAAAPAGAETTLLDAGTYDYAIVAINRFGASAPTETADVVVAAGELVRFTIADTNPVTGQEATAFRVYRRDGSKTAKTDYRYLFTFSNGATGVVDDASNLPETTKMAVFDWNMDQTFSFHQLLPMFKKPLAPIGDYEWWLQKLYVTPIVYNANRIVVFKNVGAALWE